jgi:hypothetical protein
LRKFEPGRAAGQDIDRLALEFQLYEVPEVYAGAMFFPWDRSAEVLRAWLDWTRTVPDEVTSVGRMLQFPPLPVVPEPLRGQSFAVLELVFLGDKAEGDELTEPLRALRPIMDTIGMVPPAGIAELHMDPREPMPYVGEGQLLGRLDEAGIDEAGIDAFVAAAGPGSGRAGVCGDPAPRRGTRAPAGRARLARYARLPVHDVRRRRARPRRSRGGAPPGPGADRGRARSLRHRPPVPQLHRGSTDPARFYRPDVFHRLRAVKAAYDPDDLFRANHPIPPASS